MHGVCNNWGRNCALVTVLNYMDSWYVAHEIGHTLGAVHDMWQNSCDRGLMGPGAENPYVWSDCANRAIVSLLSHQNGSCLFNEPKIIVWDLKRDPWLPSTDISADSQCSISFGPKYRRYSGPTLENKVTDPCVDMWCSYDLIRISAKCPLEGTDCVLNGRRGMCRTGRCVLQSPKDSKLEILS